MTTTIPPQTPLGKLQADKHRLQHQCKEQEERLNVHFRYLQNNAGNLLLSGVFALLSTTGTPKAEKNVSTKTRQQQHPFARHKPSASAPELPLGLSSLLKMPKLLSIGSGWMPVVWEVAQPLLVTWSIKRVKRIIGGVFTRKKNRSRPSNKE